MNQHTTTTPPLSALGELFESILQSAPVGIIVADSQGIIVFINSAILSLFGYQPSQLVGSPVESLIPNRFHSTHVGLRNSYLLDPAARQMAAGRPLVGRKQDGTEFPLQLGLSPLRTSHGNFVIASVADLSDRIRAQNAQLEAESRLQQILNNSSAVIYVKDLDGRYLFINKQYERLFHVTLASTLSRTDFDLFPHHLAQQFRDNDRHVQNTGQILEREEVAPHDDGPHTYISVKFPLFDQHGNITAIAGISTDISDRIRRLRFEQELAAAQQIQRLLYPSSAPTLRGIDLAGTFYPASQLCGDYFDFIHLPHDRLLVAVGDVSGHGLAPALEMVETRASLRALAAQDLPLREIVTQLNEILLRDLPTDMFVTLFVAEIDPLNGLISYIGAGHGAHLLRTNGNIEELESVAVALGFVEDLKLSLSTVPFHADDDLLLISTDGLVETMNPHRELFGTHRYLATAQANQHLPAQQIVSSLFTAARDFASGRPQSDDIAIVAVKCCPHDSP